MYADDLAIVCNNRKELQMALHGLKIFSDRFDLKVNVQKNEILVFGEETSFTKENSAISYDDAMIEESSEVIYLGFPLNQKMSSDDIYWKAHAALLTSIPAIKRWWTTRKDIIPFQVARDVISSILRSATGTWLPT
jgi:hypothetical protein